MEDPWADDTAAHPQAAQAQVDPWADLAAAEPPTAGPEVPGSWVDYHQEGAAIENHNRRLLDRWWPAQVAGTSHALASWRPPPGFAVQVQEPAVLRQSEWITALPEREDCNNFFWGEECPTLKFLKPKLSSSAEKPD